MSSVATCAGLRWSRPGDGMAPTAGIQNNLNKGDQYAAAAAAALERHQRDAHLRWAASAISAGQASGDHASPANRGEFGQRAQLALRWDGVCPRPRGGRVASCRWRWRAGWGRDGFGNCDAVELTAVIAGAETVLAHWRVEGGVGVIVPQNERVRACWTDRPGGRCVGRPASTSDIMAWRQNDGRCGVKNTCRALTRVSPRGGTFGDVLTTPTRWRTRLRDRPAKRRF